MWGIWEIRNLSSQGQVFASTLGPHYVLEEQSQSWQIRTQSWVGIRQKIRVLIPHTALMGDWKVGVLYASEREFDHPLQKYITIQP